MKRKITGLRAKLLFLMAIAMLLLFTFLFFAAKRILLQGYSELEKDKTLIQVKSAESLLKEQSDQLGTVTRDYAHWDDTYKFIENHDPNYIKSNLNDTTYSNLKINAIIIINPKGETVFKKGVDFTTGRPWHIATQLEQAISKGGMLIDPKRDHVSGLFWTSEGINVVSAYDVRDSELTKGRRGTLIMVRPLDNMLLAHIGGILSARLDIQYSQNSKLVNLAQLPSKTMAEVKPLNDKQIAGYKTLEDIGGTSKLILRVTDDREIFEQGKASVNFLYWSAGLVALLLVAFSWLMDKLILKRLQHLNSNVKRIDSLAKSTSRIEDLEGLDEIASLGRSINAMLGRIDESQYALELEKNRSQITLSTLSGIADAVITCNDLGQQVVYMNEAAERLSGVLASDVSGKTLQSAFHLMAEDKVTPIDSNWLIDSASTVQKVILARADGHEFVISKSTSPLNDKNGVCFGTVTVLRDITAIRALSKQLTYQASHDSLTGLINRYEFERKVQSAIDDSVSENCVHCLAYLDLDQFKIVNDTCGHMAGDALLKQLSSDLKAKMRSADTLARLGGDEFAILLMGCGLENAQLIMNDLLSLVREYRFNYEGKVFKIGASIGLTEISQSQSFTLNELVAFADSACYTAKNAGGNRIYSYVPDDNALKDRSNQIEWVSRINLSLENNQFVLYMQRMQSFTDCELHCEILVRMKGQDGKLFPPGFFLPAAERYHLMPLIDRWVVAEVFSIIASKGESFPYICAINLSGQTLSDEGFLDYVLDQIKIHEISPKCICFEITETAVITHLDKARQFIHALRGIGCRFSLDDFGSGLSSFGYLKSLEVDFLKIDGLFVKSIIENKIDRAIVESINNVGHVMQLKTIAEFAENDDIINMLKEIGVDYAQGYGVSMPEPFCLALQHAVA